MAAAVQFHSCSDLGAPTGQAVSPAGKGRHAVRWGVFGFCLGVFALSSRIPRSPGKATGLRLSVPARRGHVTARRFAVGESPPALAVLALRSRIAQSPDSFSIRSPRPRLRRERDTRSRDCRCDRSGPMGIAILLSERPQIETARCRHLSLSLDCGSGLAVGWRGKQRVRIGGNEGARSAGAGSRAVQPQAMAADVGDVLAACPIALLLQPVRRGDEVGQKREWPGHLAQRHRPRDGKAWIRSLPDRCRRPGRRWRDSEKPRRVHTDRRTLVRRLRRRRPLPVGRSPELRLSV